MPHTEKPVVPQAGLEHPDGTPAAAELLSDLPPSLPCRGHWGPLRPPGTCQSGPPGSQPLPSGTPRGPRALAEPEAGPGAGESGPRASQLHTAGCRDATASLVTPSGPHRGTCLVQMTGFQKLISVDSGQIAGGWGLWADLGSPPPVHMLEVLSPRTSDVTLSVTVTAAVVQVTAQGAGGP